MWARDGTVCSPAPSASPSHRLPLQTGQSCLSPAHSHATALGSLSLTSPVREALQGQSPTAKMGSSSAHVRGLPEAHPSDGCGWIFREHSFHFFSSSLRRQKGVA